MADKNYITPKGHEKLVREFEQLSKVERPEVVQVIQWAAGNGDRSENADYIYGKRRLREIDKRLGFLAKRLEAAEIVDPQKIKSDKVQFGATVTIQDEDGDEKTFSIVGVDEINTEKGRISWRSPIGSGLIGKKEGDVATISTPNGTMELEILKVEYLSVLEE